MKISTEIGSCARRVGERKAIELYAKAGFDAWDFTMMAMVSKRGPGQIFVSDHPLNGTCYLSFVRELKQIGLDNGIHCNQSHAPFPLCSPLIRDMMKRAIECTAEAGGNICIIHPDSTISIRENADMYHELLPFAKSHGVKIATENMWDWDKELDQAKPVACSNVPAFRAQLDEVNDEAFVACLDIGHANSEVSDIPVETWVRRWAPCLGHVHIHNNWGGWDLHNGLEDGTIPIEETLRLLDELAPKATWTLESLEAEPSCRWLAQQGWIEE